LKISKELKTGVIAIAAIGLLITGVNFLKGKSFFGGDTLYYAYFANAGNIAPASTVTLNGVKIGTVMDVKINPNATPERMAIISFNVTNKEINFPKDTYIEIGSLDLLSKGLIVHMGDASKGMIEKGGYMRGEMSKDITEQAKEMIAPIQQKIEVLMGKLDKTVGSISSFWDETGSGAIEGSMREVQIAIKRFGNVAEQAEGLLIDERAKFGKILSNVENISDNLRASNASVNKIIGNATKISDDLVSADFKMIMADAGNTIKKLNIALTDASEGKGTLGKLLYDDKLYTSLVQTNVELQNLLNDLQLHPERYIHFSVLGARTKGVPLTGLEEKKLRKILDSIPN
jgi:phospholipid/cholesterol/gamma-HCH transport system substrate-binding protein